MRVIGHVKLDEYETRYVEAFRRAASAPPENKLPALLAPDVKLPGVDAPTGSTIIHFIHPDSVPIIDVAQWRSCMKPVWSPPHIAISSATRNFVRPLGKSAAGAPIGPCDKSTRPFSLITNWI